MLTAFVHLQGTVRKAHVVDPSWLEEDSKAIVWVDLAAPTAEEATILRDVFHFHELSIEDALSELHHPKIETYDGYLYVILHGIDFQASRHRFATHDTDFFVGRNYLVTVHDGTSRSIQHLRDLCLRNVRILGEGPVALLHRTVDLMVDNYGPEVEKLREKLDRLEQRVLERPTESLVKQILDLKREVASLRRVVLPQRDVVSRLARKEFGEVEDPVAYRFRDVYDHLVRLADEAMLFHDRLSALLDAHLTNVSNRLNQVMKVLTVISTIFMPLTVLTGMWGMNIPLPAFPGDARVQFWWLVGIMLTLAGAMLGLFRLRRWL